MPTFGKWLKFRILFQDPGFVFSVMLLRPELNVPEDNHNASLLCFLR